MRPPRRFPGLLLIACFCFWASGAAQFAHLRMDHSQPTVAISAGGAGPCLACAKCGQGLIARLRLATALAKRKPPAPAQAPIRSTGDCHLCQLLAAMLPTVATLPAAAPALDRLPDFAIAPAAPEPLLIDAFNPLPPSHGPPSA
jgi:hypothetical protein